MSNISTHVLDVTRGVAAAGIAVTLEVQSGGMVAGPWRTLTTATTDIDGRVKAMLTASTPLSAATYRLRWETGAYWKKHGVESFHPVIEVTFTITEATRHHHVPLLLSPFGYTTYRGS